MSWLLRANPGSTQAFFGIEAVNNSNHNPLPDLHSTYLDLLSRALPNVADMGDRVSAMITLVQDAKAILRDGEPDPASRAEVALTAVLTALKLTSMELDKAANGSGAAYSARERSPRATGLTAGGIPLPGRWQIECQTRVLVGTPGGIKI